MPSWMAARRATGSCTSVASEVNIDDTWLPMSARASSGLTDTGTMARSGPSTSSPRRSKYWRRVPAHRARTTSFTVVPKAFFTRFTSESDTEVVAIDRRGVMAPLIDVAGAVNGSGASSWPGWRVRLRTSSAAWPVRRSALSTRSGCRASDDIA